MALSKEEKSKRIDAWQKDNIRRIVVKLSKVNPRDQKLIEQLDKQDSIQGYIKDLIEADMQ